MQNKSIFNSIFTTVTIIVTIILIGFIIYGLHLGIFKDKEFLVYYIKSLGIFACIFFILLQAFQVIFPVIPGGASCLAGVLAFGPILGFIYNYIGLVIGSTIAFLLSRKFGLPLVQKLFKQQTIDKYLKYIKGNSFNKIFTIGIFAPGLPDDLLCYIAGLSNMSLKKFLIIILLGKPWTLLLYSFFIELL